MLARLAAPLRPGLRCSCVHRVHALRLQVDQQRGMPATTPHRTPGFELKDRDVGQIVHVDHLMLQCDNLDHARLFYADGLGMTLDPGVWSRQRGGHDVLWFNLGRHQIHVGLPLRPQRLSGSLTLVLSDRFYHDILPDRLAYIAEHLQGTRFAVEARGEEATRVVDPWGQRFLLRPKALEPGFAASMGIAEFTLACAAGTAPVIAHFYRTAFGARADVAPAGGEAWVHMGPGTRIHFQEDPHVTDTSPESLERLQQDWHFAYYCAAYSPALELALERDLVKKNHSFFDQVTDYETGLRFHQFRFDDVIALEDMCTGEHSFRRGQVVARFGNEPRNLHHPKFMRGLYNKYGDNFDVPEGTQGVI